MEHYLRSRLDEPRYHILEYHVGFKQLQPPRPIATAGGPLIAATGQLRNLRI
jgi:hypothetical protein